MNEFKTVNREGWRVSRPFRILTNKSVLDIEDEYDCDYEREVLYAEQMAILEKLDFDFFEEEYVIYFGTEKGLIKQSEAMTIDEAVQCLALKDGADLVEFEDGRIGFVGYYNGFNENYLELEKIPHAELIVNSSEGFSNDIWQMEGKFTTEQWQTTLTDMADTLQGIYEYLDGTEEYGGGCAELYTLGDIINMLHNIKVK